METDSICEAPPSTVLSFAAPIEAGKTKVSKLVAKRLGAPWVSFGEYLRRLAKNRGLEVTRETLQDLGEELVRDDVRAFCLDVLKEQPWRPGVPLIIDGLRHLEVLNALGDIFNPAPEYLIYIQVDRLTQEKRLRRDELPHEKSLDDLEKHSTESQVRSVLPDKAALILDGARPPEELTQKVIDFLKAPGPNSEDEFGWRKKNALRIELAKKKNREGLTAAELAEFDQLQTSISDYLDAKYPRTPLDSDLLDQIEAQIKLDKKKSEGE
jgi:adenylate kinase family enzyme